MKITFFSVNNVIFPKFRSYFRCYLKYKIYFVFKLFCLAIRNIPITNRPFCLFFLFLLQINFYKNLVHTDFEALCFMISLFLFFILFHNILSFFLCLLQHTLMLLSVRFGCYYKPHLWSRINIFTKISFLIVWQGSEYAYELPSQFTSFHVLISKSFMSSYVIKYVFFQSKTMPCYEKCFLFNKYPNFRCIVPQNSFLIPILKCNQALLMHLNLV